MDKKVDFTTESNETVTITPKDITFAAQLVRIYAWMFTGLLLTAVMSYFTYKSSLQYLALRPYGFIALSIGEIALVWYLSGRIFTMRYENASALFIIYSGLNGLTLSVIFIRYELGSIALAFAISAGYFAFMSIFGLITKKDLSRMGNFMLAALIGLIIITLFNIFLHSDQLTIIISYIGVVIFLGLTAYDTQKLKKYYEVISDSDDMKKFSILGALTLYLDFINLFLYILRILGRKK